MNVAGLSHRLGKWGKASSWSIMNGESFAVLS